MLSKRRIVERTLGWLNRCRRPSKDYEATIRSAEVMIKLILIYVIVPTAHSSNRFLDKL